MNTSIRTYDGLDPVTLTAFWIGEDASVEVPSTMIGRMGRIVENSGWYARVGTTPAQLGIEVTTFGVAYVAPMYSLDEDAERAEAASAWRALADALRAPEIDESTQITAVLDEREPANTRTRKIAKQVATVLANA